MSSASQRRSPGSYPAGSPSSRRSGQNLADASPDPGNDSYATYMKAYRMGRAKMKQQNQKGSPAASGPSPPSGMKKRAEATGSQGDATSGGRESSGPFVLASPTVNEPKRRRSNASDASSRTGSTQHSSVAGASYFRMEQEFSSQAEPASQAPEFQDDMMGHEDSSDSDSIEFQIHSLAEVASVTRSRNKKRNTGDEADTAGARCAQIAERPHAQRPLEILSHYHIVAANFGTQDNEAQSADVEGMNESIPEIVELNRQLDAALQNKIAEEAMQEISDTEVTNPFVVTPGDAQLQTTARAAGKGSSEVVLQADVGFKPDTGSQPSVMAEQDDKVNRHLNFDNKTGVSAQGGEETAKDIESKVATQMEELQAVLLNAKALASREDPQAEEVRAPQSDLPTSDSTGQARFENEISRLRHELAPEGRGSPAAADPLALLSDSFVSAKEGLKAELQLMQQGQLSVERVEMWQKQDHGGDPNNSRSEHPAAEATSPPWSSKKDRLKAELQRMRAQLQLAQKARKGTMSRGTSNADPDELHSSDVLSQAQSEIEEIKSLHSNATRATVALESDQPSEDKEFVDNQLADETIEQVEPAEEMSTETGIELSTDVQKDKVASEIRKLYDNLQQVGEQIKDSGAPGIKETNFGEEQQKMNDQLQEQLSKLHNVVGKPEGAALLGVGHSVENPPDGGQHKEPDVEKSTKETIDIRIEGEDSRHKETIFSTEPSEFGPDNEAVQQTLERLEDALDQVNIGMKAFLVFALYCFVFGLFSPWGYPCFAVALPTALISAVYLLKVTPLQAPKDRVMPWQIILTVILFNFIAVMLFLGAIFSGGAANSVSPLFGTEACGGDPILGTVPGLQGNVTDLPNASRRHDVNDTLITEEYAEFLSKLAYCTAWDMCSDMGIKMTTCAAMHGLNVWNSIVFFFAFLLIPVYMFYLYFGISTRMEEYETAIKTGFADEADISVMGMLSFIASNLAKLRGNVARTGSVSGGPKNAPNSDSFVNDAQAELLEMDRDRNPKNGLQDHRDDAAAGVVLGSLGGSTKRLEDEGREDRDIRGRKHFDDED